VGAVVFPAEADAAVLAGEETAVGDGDAVGVAAEIVENLLRPAERAFGVNDPFDAAQRLEMLAEGLGLGERRELAEEPQLGCIERLLQVLDEQATVEARENADGEEEGGPASDPASVGCKAAARHDAVDVRMMRKGLAPGVQEGDHAGLGAEMLGVGADDADG